MEQQRGGVVAEVAPGSLGEDLGLRPGDRLVAINGRPLKDLIDYLSELDSDEVLLSVERQDGEQLDFEVEKETGEGLGIEFESAVFDGIRRCHNRCIFCFVDQLPPGVRPSLQVKDDDYRLSFCQGNYLTLTNLTEADVSRIVDQRLSPLYVSVHATDPEVRRAMVRNPRAGAEGLEILHRLLDGGIHVHAQLVLCPGWNDGPVLERTLADLAEMGEGIQSIAAVPVGVSRWRHSDVSLRSFRADEASAVLGQIHRWQANFYAERETRLVFAADEFYLRAHEPIPPASAYEDFAQLEDGVGLVRNFWEEAASALEEGPCRPSTEPLHIVTGLSGAQALQPLLLGLQRRNLALGTRLMVVPNRFFDPESITVTGLLTGSDLATAVQEARQRGERVERLLVPELLFRSGCGITLDDLTASEVAERSGAALEIIPPSGEALVKRLCR